MADDKKICIFVAGACCIVLIVIIVLAVGFGVDAANCWADENDISYCDYMITIKVENLPYTSTR